MPTITTQNPQKNNIPQSNNKNNNNNKSSPPLKSTNNNKSNNNTIILNKKQQNTLNSLTTATNFTSLESHSSIISQITNYHQQDSSQLSLDLQYVFEYNTEDDDIFDAFEELCAVRKFQLIQKQDNYVTAIKEINTKNSQGFMNKVNIAFEAFTNCLPFGGRDGDNQRLIISSNSQSNQQVLTNNSNTKKKKKFSSYISAPTAMKMTLSKIQNSSKNNNENIGSQLSLMSICHIKGLSGLIREIKIFIQQFKQKTSVYSTYYQNNINSLNIKSIKSNMSRQSQSLENNQNNSNNNNSSNFPKPFFYDIDKLTQYQIKRTSNEYSNPYEEEVVTYYMIEKILTNKILPQSDNMNANDQKTRNNNNNANNNNISQFHKYKEVAQIVEKLLSDYQSTFKNIKESVELLPQPMINLTKIVNEIYSLFQEEDKKKQNNQKSNHHHNSKENNISNKNTNNTKNTTKIYIHSSMIPYLRLAIENYIFKKQQSLINTIYKEKNNKMESIFLEKRQKIFLKFTLRQIFEEVSLDEKFWSIDSQDSWCLDSRDFIADIKEIKNQNQQLFINTNKASLAQKPGQKIIHLLKQIRLVKMSTNACSQLQKIQTTSNPRQKIKYMQLCYTGLKTFFYDYSKHKYELSSMQDIIPVLIFIVLLCDIKDFRKELDIMGDFIESDPYQMQSEKRLYINLSESFNYVIRDWKV